MLTKCCLHAGVELLHHMFVLEHNWLCSMLRTSYAELDEEELYHTSRLIVAAVMAHIHTVEWTPALLNNDLLNVSMHQNWDGLSQAFLTYELSTLQASSRLQASASKWVTRCSRQVADRLKKVSNTLQQARS